MAVWNVTLTDSAQRRASREGAAPGGPPLSSRPPGWAYPYPEGSWGLYRGFLNSQIPFLWTSGVFVEGNDKNRLWFIGRGSKPDQQVPWVSVLPFSAIQQYLPSAPRKQREERQPLASKRPWLIEQKRVLYMVEPLLNSELKRKFTTVCSVPSGWEVRIPFLSHTR